MPGKKVDSIKIGVVPDWNLRSYLMDNLSRYFNIL